jgi:phosphate transporter
MKFSHSIQFNAVPDWSSHYIAYSNLKKLIYTLEKTVHQTGRTDNESRPLLNSEEPETVFTRALDVELEKISSFYQIKEKELLDEVDEVLRDVESLQANGEDGFDASARPGSGPSPDHVRQFSIGRGVRSMRSTEDGIEDSDSDDDETSALNKKRRSSISAAGGGGRRRTLANIQTSDLGASTELPR